MGGTARTCNPCFVENIHLLHMHARNSEVKQTATVHKYTYVGRQMNIRSRGLPPSGGTRDKRGDLIDITMRYSQATFGLRLLLILGEVPLLYCTSAHHPAPHIRPPPPPHHPPSTSGTRSALHDCSCPLHHSAPGTHTPGIPSRRGARSDGEGRLHGMRRHCFAHRGLRMHGRRDGGVESQPAALLLVPARGLWRPGRRDGAVC